jgi:diguanylate cyclase (GGDEF)-like protein
MPLPREDAERAREAADVRFGACSAAPTVAAACAGVVADLVAAGFELPSVYLLHGRRLRCQAAHGYFQVVDGFTPGVGVVGSVVATGRSELVEDVSQRTGFIAALPGVVAEGCSPVVADGRVVGAISVESRSVLPEHTLTVLEAAARALGDRIQQLGGLPLPSSAQLLSGASVALAAHSDAGEIEQRAVVAAAELSGMRSAALVVDRGEGPAVRAATGPLAPVFAAWDAAALGVLSSWVHTGTSSHLPGGDSAPPSDPSLAAAGVRSLSVYPMVVSGRGIGWLFVADTVAVTEAPGAVDLLEVLASHTAAAVALADVLASREHLDDLTGLGNRAHLTATSQALLDARRETNGWVALLVLDVDGFKHVNDALGHAVGDRVLVEVSRRLRASLRDTDVACRIGGDEFAVLMPDASPGTALAIAERILAAVSRPMTGDGAELEVTASVGIAMGRARDETPEGLLKAADLAMYLAKERGHGRYAFFEPQLQEAALNRLGLLSDLRKAIRSDALSLAYQPIVDLGTGAMTGLEVLVRWEDPERGPVPPSEFIPLAEETGLILPLGEWVLREASAQLLLWDAEGGSPSLKLSINVSTRQLERGQLLTVLDECLAGGLAPHRLVLEITETALTLDTVAARETLDAIRERGVHLAVDDFGIGYSSLAMLRSAPVSRLKIDREFVSEIAAGDADVPIVDATMAMARGLGLAVVAEGVETSIQLAYLRDAGCPEAQGFLLARPMAAADVGPLVTGSRPWAEVLRSITRHAPEVRPALAGLIDLTVSPTADLDALIQPLLAELEAMTGLEMAYLTSVDSGRTAQRVDVVRGPAGSPLVPGLVVPWQDTLCRRALSDGPQRTSDAQAQFPDAAAAQELELRAYIVEPVLAPDGELYGTLCAASRTPTDLSDADSATVRLFARLVTEKLRQLAGPAAPAAAAAAGGAGVGIAAAATARLQRRAVAAQSWRRVQEARRRAARSVLDRRPAHEPSRRQLAVLEAAERAFTLHAAGLARAGVFKEGVDHVVLADDDAVMRQLMSAFVGASPALHLAAEAASGAEAIGFTAAEQPDILVLDYDLGDLTAEELVADVRMFAPGTQIILYSGRSDVSELGQRLGVDRAVYKGDDVHRLIEALAALAS